MISKAWSVNAELVSLEDFVKRKFTTIMMEKDTEKVWNMKTKRRFNLA